MKIKCLAIIGFLIMIIIIPICSASPGDLDNVTEVSDEIMAEKVEVDYEEINSPINSSYYDDNNENIEQPLLDDSFKEISVKYTSKNTFYVNGSYNGSTELGTLNNPFKNIDVAFSSLTFNRSVSNIYIASGVYELQKTISLTKNLNIIGENPVNTIISGKYLNQLFFVNKNNLALTFVNLTFVAGNTYYGGAIYNNKSSIKLINDIFKENTAEGYSSTYSGAGGALYNEAGTYKIYNSTFINNKAKSSLNVYAAAIYNDMGTLSILNSKFINNSVENGSYGCGGAIYNFNGFLTVFNTTFENNTICSNYSIGGAIYNYEAHNVYVINSTFEGNKIYGNYTIGSAIANSASLFEVVNSTITNNVANGTALDNSTIFNFNGIYNFINSTFHNNIVKNPKKYLLMCLEDQFIISKAFNDDLIKNLPSKYDLREEGLVTYAKNQGSSGACWAFTTIAALESYLLKYENISYDLSENNLKNVMGYRSENGTDWADGGNYQMALAYFLRWSGPIDEDDDYFSAYSTIPHYEYSPLKHVQGAVFIPMRLGYLDNNQIKYAIMKYGAVYTSIYGTSMIKNVYNSVSEIPNHAIAIVGWDDNYPASKFSGSKPPANGAFIIKNSWGTSYGEKGFGYVSYYDKTLAGFSLDSLSVMAFTDVENVTNYKDIYQYDLLGNTFESIGYSNSTAWLANQFTAISDNPLSAFGLYTYGKSSYMVEIYVNGNLKYSQDGCVDYAGYHTIKLNKLVNLSKNDVFRINVKLTTPDSFYPIAIESQRNGYSSKSHADLNQSFISPDGVNWFDIAQDFEIVKLANCLYNKTLSQANVCLKAYTANVGDLRLNITSNSSYFYKGDEIKVSLNLTNYGDYVKDIIISLKLDEIINISSINLTKGIFNNNTWNISELSHNGFAILNLTIKILDNRDFIKNTISVNCSDNIYDNQSYQFNLTYCGFTNFIVNNITSLSKSGDIFNITLVDNQLNPIYNENVIVNVNNENITLKTDENGIINLKLDLLEGNYSCFLYFKGNEKYHGNNQSFNVKVIKRNSTIINVGEDNYYYPNGPLIRLTDENDNPLNKLLKIMLIDSSGKTTIFNYTTDNGGQINLSNIKSGDYKIISEFEGDDLYYSSIYDFNAKILKVDSVLTSNDLYTSTVISKVDGKTGNYIKIILKDVGSNPLENKQINVNLNSKNYNLITDKFGTAYLQVNIERSGNYIAIITFKGDNQYSKSFTQSKIVVKKQKLTLKVPKKTYKSSKKVKKLTATLKNSKGKAISGKKLVFKVNGKKYTVKTNKKGKSIVKVKISKKKTYKVSVTFKGDLSYNKITKKSKLVIR